MIPPDIERIAAAIATAFHGGAAAVIPAAMTLDAGYAVQDRALALLGAAPDGWKVGMATADAQAQAGLAGPTFGPVPAGRVRPSGHVWAAGSFRAARLEPEIALRMAQDCRDTGRPYDARSIAAHVGSVHPAIEIVDSRAADVTGIDMPGVVADLNFAGGLVLGAALDMTAEAARALPVSADLTGPPFAVLAPGARPDPLACAAALANHLLARGTFLRAGQVVTTGAMAPPVAAGAGLQRIGFGTAAITFTL